MKHRQIKELREAEVKIGAEMRPKQLRAA